MASPELPRWRRRAQAPALAFAVVAILASTYIIHQKRSVASGPVTVGARQTRKDPKFDLTNLTIPVDEIRSGGPSKDGIPALTNPETVSADEADFLADTDSVVGVRIGGESRAYPLKILDYHEIVNDTLGGVPIAVTYCPLCDSTVVFDRRRDDEVLELGVSGRLYNSNVLMYARNQRGEGEPLVSQMAGALVSGPTAGQRLRQLPVVVTRWSAWRDDHPNATVLSDQTGYSRRYNRSVYARYFSSDQLMFPVQKLDDRLPPKTPVIGVRVGEQQRAYIRLGVEPRMQRSERLGGAAYQLVADSEGQLSVADADGDVAVTYAFWYAWATFHPDTELIDLRPQAAQDPQRVATNANAPVSAAESSATRP